MRMGPLLLVCFFSGISLVGGQDVEWISRPAEGDISVRGENRRADISKNGRFVVFQSKGALIEEDTDRYWDIYRFDRKENRLTKEGADLDDHANGGVSLSANGRTLAFHSYPPHVVRGKPPRLSDIYFSDLVREETIPLNRPVTLSPDDGENINPDLDKTGRFTVFSSNASHLQPGVENVFRSIFLYDRKADQLTLISRSTDGQPNNRPAMEPKISENGRFVAFKSAATNFQPVLPKESLSYHLYVFDRRQKKLNRVDLKIHGLDPDSRRIGQFAMDSRGVLIVFEGFLKNADDPQAAIETSDIFLFDRGLKEISKISGQQFDGAAHSPSISGDGRYIAFVSKGFDEPSGGIVVLDRKKGTYRKILDGTCENPLLSGNGEVLVFDSTDPKWRNESKGKDRHIYVVKNPFKH